MMCRSSKSLSTCLLFSACVAIPTVLPQETPATDGTPIVLYSAYADSTRLERKVKSLEKKNRDLRDAITRLKGRVRSLLKENAAGRKQLNRAQEQIDRLTAELDSARRELEATRQALVSVEAENAELAATNNALAVALVARTAELEDLQRENQALAGQVRKLESQLEIARLEKEALERECARLKLEAQAADTGGTTSIASPTSTGAGKGRRLPKTPAEGSGDTATRSTEQTRAAESLPAVRLPGLRLAAYHVATPAGPSAGRSSSEAEKPDVFRLVAEGQRLLELGEVEQAHANFQAALEAKPDLREARLGLAACYYIYGALPEAADLTQSVLRNDPRHPTALSLMALIAWRRGELGRARELIRQATEIDPEDPRIHNYAGIILHADGEDDSALEHFRKAVALDQNYAEAYFNLAVLLAESYGRTGEARQAYRKALECGAEPDPWLEDRLKENESASAASSTAVPTIASGR